MGTKRSVLGQLGEEAAARYLSQKKYRIIVRNFRRSFGELDIVAMAPDKTLVFVEVKTTTPGRFKPEDQMTKAKLTKFKRAASLYAGAHQKLIKDKKGWRLDLVALVYESACAGRPAGFRVRHYENIFL
ncbi:MAG: YraN family protein [Candidatus Jorgensenbacteria bacterium]